MFIPSQREQYNCLKSEYSGQEHHGKVCQRWTIQSFRVYELFLCFKLHNGVQGMHIFFSLKGHTYFHEPFSLHKIVVSYCLTGNVNKCLFDNFKGLLMPFFITTCDYHFIFMKWIWSHNCRMAITD